MSEERLGGARPARRLRAVPSAGPAAGTSAASDAVSVPVYADLDLPRPLIELASSDPASVPRIAPLDDLLREVDGLRSALRKDLSLAATALEAGEPALAGYLVRGAAESVQGFSVAASADLAGLADHAEAPPLPVAVGSQPALLRFTRSLLPQAPFAAAAALVALLAGPAVPDRVVSGTTEAAAVSSYHELTRLAAEGASTEEVVEAAEELHDRLAPLVDQAEQDPEAARQALVLLQAEHAVLVLEGVPDSVIGQQVLREARALVTRLRRAMPKTPIVIPAPAAPAPGEESRPQSGGQADGKPSPKPSPKASSSPKASPSPAPKPSEQPKSSPRPSSSPTENEEDKGPLPDPIR